METAAFLISVPEASRLLNVSPNLLYRLIKGGQIPAYRLSPRTTRIDVAELRSALKLQPAETENHVNGGAGNKAGAHEPAEG